MNRGATVLTPKTADGGARGVGQARSTQHATRAAHLALRTPHSALRMGFTLIEIMVVVAIMGIVMTMGVPIVYKVWRKAPMRQAVADIVEVCSHARARAIMQGTPTEVVFHPKLNRLEIAGAAAPSRPAVEGTETPVVNLPLGAKTGTSAQLSDRVIIEFLDINMAGFEFNDVDEARVRFYPNGIADEMRMILFDGKDRVGIELETTTGLADVVPDPLREWTRR